MSLRDLWHKKYNLWLKVSECYLLRQEKRMDCALGEWWLWCSQSVSTGICWTVTLVEKFKSCFVILRRLNNFIGIICQSCNMCLPNFNVFGNLGRNFMNEKLKGSLIAPVLITSKCVTGSLWQRFRHSFMILIGNVHFGDWQSRLSKQRHGLL